MGVSIWPKITPADNSNILQRLVGPVSDRDSTYRILQTAQLADIQL
jgi:hypothetical protein